MKTSEIIRVYAYQSTPCDSSEAWFDNMKVQLKREHLIQVLKDKNHMMGIISHDTLDKWFELNSWSDLVSMMDKCLGIESESYLNTIN